MFAPSGGLTIHGLGLDAMGNWDFDQVILGEPASGKNARRIVLFGKRPALIKSKKALEYSKQFHEQCKKLSPLIENDVAILIDVFYRSRRPDLDCGLIHDLLQGYVIKNDRQIKASMALHNLDKEEPRCRIRVRSIDVRNYSGLSSFKVSKIWDTDTDWSDEQ